MLIIEHARVLLVLAITNRRRFAGRTAALRTVADFLARVDCATPHSYRVPVDLDHCREVAAALRLCCEHLLDHPIGHDYEAVTLTDVCAAYVAVNCSIQRPHREPEPAPAFCSPGVLAYCEKTVARFAKRFRRSTHGAEIQIEILPAGSPISVDSWTVEEWPSKLGLPNAYKYRVTCSIHRWRVPVGASIYACDVFVGGSCMRLVELTTSSANANVLVRQGRGTSLVVESGSKAVAA